MADKSRRGDLAKLIVYPLAIGAVYILLDTGILPYSKEWRTFLATRFSSLPLAILLTGVVLISLCYLVGRILPDLEPNNIWLRVVYRVFKALDTSLLSETVLGFMIVISIVGLLILYSLRCDENLIAFQISQDVFISESQYSAEPGDALVIQTIAYDTRSELQEPFNCQWDYVGDGAVTGKVRCSLQLRFGEDEAEDVITVKVSQRNCRQSTLAVLFIRPRKE